ncbi:unnamed protein product [Didymodactylos carnosus]|uniref:Large ribosomal subunit protein uL15m n=1 Tax=Didymodactylos carnosus TaxID=1234261 RepID=A0A8S2GLP4_9BILA|nr:unnamed protein product [Didymodactylos carnosus]CAF3532505.1 unnamed protein product [Didymodactylos carnosus]
MGKTSTRGYKGQKARKSGHTRPGFEGGQTPLFRRLPKIGFSNFRNQVDRKVITTRMINDLNTIDLSRKNLKALRIISSEKQLIKVIGKDPIKLAVKIEVSSISPNAQKAIEAAGGSVTLN